MKGQAMPERVLVVEDDPASMKMLLMCLRNCGYILLEARDGREALEVAIREHPDIILMDLGLPELSGVEVAERLRQMPLFQDLPIIAVSAHAMAGDREAALRAGFDAYLTKPVNTRQLPIVLRDKLAARKEGVPQIGGKGCGEEDSGR